MRGWMLAVLAVAPEVLIVTYLYDFGDWQFWALWLAAMWWALFSRVDQYLDDRATQEGEG